VIVLAMQDLLRDILGGQLLLPAKIALWTPKQRPVRGTL
jgi:hypothetical protein